MVGPASPGDGRRSVVARPGDVRRGMVVGRAVLTVACVLVLAGCGAVLPGRAVPARVATSDLELIQDYVREFNAAGDAGAQVQTDFLRATQAAGTPLPPARCFGAYTLSARLVERTLRPAPPDWTPPGARPGRPGEAGPRRPDGAVYVVASSVTASRNGVAVREDVGSKHLVVRDGQVFGYAACPT